MRKIRTIGRLIEYLEANDCPISRSTIQRLIRTKEIPHTRISSQILIFDLDEIDDWL